MTCIAISVSQDCGTGYNYRLELSILARIEVGLLLCSYSGFTIVFLVFVFPILMRIIIAISVSQNCYGI